MTENQWQETLTRLSAELNGVITAATDAFDTARLMLRGYGNEPDMQSDVDYFDLCEFMEDLEKRHKTAQELMKRFYQEEQNQ